MMNFAEFLAKEEKSVVLYGLNKKGSSPGKSVVKSHLKSVKPAKAVSPFSGLSVPGEIFGKSKRKSGIVGE